MGNKQRKVVSKSILPSEIILQKNQINCLNLLPNDILFSIFDYLLPVDIVRAFEYDLERFSGLIRQHIVVYGFNLLKIQSNDSHLIPICLLLIKQQHLSICTKDNLLSTVLKSISSPTTLTVIINTSFEQSFLSKISLKSINCKKLIIEYTPSYDRQMNDNDIIPLLSTSVNTLILRNVVFLLNQSRKNSSSNSLHHIRCILKDENDLYELLIRFPMLISIDIRLISHHISKLLTILPVPKHFRIEYPYETVINLDRFPNGIKYYDQTVYSLPWFNTNSSLVLRACNPKNYLNSFPYPLLYIRQLTIECTYEPWSLEFVTFLRQTFPNTRTLYALQEYDTQKRVMTTMTANDRKMRRCTLHELFRQTSLNSTSFPTAIRFLSIDRAYN